MSLTNSMVLPTLQKLVRHEFSDRNDISIPNDLGSDNKSTNPNDLDDVLLLTMH